MKRYIIGWRRHEGGLVKMRYYMSRTPMRSRRSVMLTKTELISRAWSTTDKKRANRVCRQIIEEWSDSGRWAHVIEVDERELFMEGLKGR